jgi:hypothetical protein
MELQTDEQLLDAHFTDKTTEIQLICYAESYSKHA